MPRGGPTTRASSKTTSDVQMIALSLIEQQPGRFRVDRRTLLRVEFCTAHVDVVSWLP